MIYVALFILLFIVPGTFGYTSKAYSLWWAALGAVALLTQRHRLQEGANTPMEKPIVCLFAWAIFVIPFCPNWRIGVVGMLDDYSNGLAMAIICAIVFYVVSLRDELDEDVILKLLAWSGAGSALIGLIQVAWSPPWLPGGRAVGTIGGPSYFGCYMAMVLPAALLSRQYASAAAIALGLAASGSRGAWISGALAVAMALKGSNLKARTLVMILTGCAGASAAAWLYAIKTRPTAFSDACRFEAWKGAIAMWKFSPFAGFGPGSYAVFAKTRGPDYIHTRAHNDVLEIMATTGAVGLILYAWAWAMLIWRAWKARSLAARAAAGGLAAFFVSIKFNPTCVETTTVAAVMAGLLFREYWQEKGLA